MVQTLRRSLEQQLLLVEVEERRLQKEETALKALAKEQKKMEQEELRKQRYSEQVLKDVQEFRQEKEEELEYREKEAQLRLRTVRDAEQMDAVGHELLNAHAIRLVKLKRRMNTTGSNSTNSLNMRNASLVSGSNMNSLNRDSNSVSGYMSERESLSQSPNSPNNTNNKIKRIYKHRAMHHHQTLGAHGTAALVEHHHLKNPVPETDAFRPSKRIVVEDNHNYNNQTSSSKREVLSTLNLKGSVLSNNGGNSILESGSLKVTRNSLSIVGKQSQLTRDMVKDNDIRLNLVTTSEGPNDNQIQIHGHNQQRLKQPAYLTRHKEINKIKHELTGRDRLDTNGDGRKQEDIKRLRKQQKKIRRKKFGSDNHTIDGNKSIGSSDDDDGVISDVSSADTDELEKEIEFGNRTQTQSPINIAKIREAKPSYAMHTQPKTLVLAPGATPDRYETKTTSPIHTRSSKSQSQSQSQSSSPPHQNQIHHPHAIEDGGHHEDHYHLFIRHQHRPSRVEKKAEVSKRQVHYTDDYEKAMEESMRMRKFGNTNIDQNSDSNSNFLQNRQPQSNGQSKTREFTQLRGATNVFASYVVDDNDIDDVDFDGSKATKKFGKKSSNSVPNKQQYLRNSPNTKSQQSVQENISKNQNHINQIQNHLPPDDHFDVENPEKVLQGRGNLAATLGRGTHIAEGKGRNADLVTSPQDSDSRSQSQSQGSPLNNQHLSYRDRSMLEQDATNKIRTFFRQSLKKQESERKQKLSETIHSRVFDNQNSESTTGKGENNTINDADSNNVIKDNDTEKMYSLIAKNASRSSHGNAHLLISLREQSAKVERKSRKQKDERGYGQESDSSSDSSRDDDRLDTVKRAEKIHHEKHLKQQQQNSKNGNLKQNIREATAVSSMNPNFNSNLSPGQGVTNTVSSSKVPETVLWDDTAHDISVFTSKNIWDELKAQQKQQSQTKKIQKVSHQQIRQAKAVSNANSTGLVIDPNCSAFDENLTTALSSGDERIVSTRKSQTGNKRSSGSLSPSLSPNKNGRTQSQSQKVPDYTTDPFMLYHETKEWHHTLPGGSLHKPTIHTIKAWDRKKRIQYQAINWIAATMYRLLLRVRKRIRERDNDQQRIDFIIRIQKKWRNRAYLNKARRTMEKVIWRKEWYVQQKLIYKVNLWRYNARIKRLKREEEEEEIERKKQAEELKRKKQKEEAEEKLRIEREKQRIEQERLAKLKADEEAKKKKHKWFKKFW